MHMHEHNHGAPTCCDCLWRIHLKFRQTTANKVQIKSSGKIQGCLLDRRYKMKRMQVKYRLNSIDRVTQVCSGAVRLEECECRAGWEGEGGQLCFGTVWGNLVKSECVLKHFASSIKEVFDVPIWFVLRVHGCFYLFTVKKNSFKVNSSQMSKQCE